jgi:hypothetical protein
MRGFVHWGGRHLLMSFIKIIFSPHHHGYFPLIRPPHANANPPGSSACGACAGKSARTDG